jgi:hypothetical protein
VTSSEAQEAPIFGSYPLRHGGRQRLRLKVQNMTFFNCGGLLFRQDKGRLAVVVGAVVRRKKMCVYFISTGPRRFFSSRAGSEHMYSLTYVTYVTYVTYASYVILSTVVVV